MTKKGNSSNFIEFVVAEDIKNKKKYSKVVTRFPPEPNGHLHIGHAKSICLNFRIAELYNGVCNLRFDDTNPATENTEYVDGIIKDIRWLGFDWGKKEVYASDYFDFIYKCAVRLIELEKAYVDDLSNDDIRLYRGTLKKSGINSPFRNRSVHDNLNLFALMKNGEFKDGEKVLRAKINMSHPNLVMRDPVLYRIKKNSHYRTGYDWCIYPMYDLAHCISDSIEGVSHSLCTLEFENNRPLYDWILDSLVNVHHPTQIEFARLNLSYTILSKRKLIQLVENGYVSGWDDPRMPTISGLRRRGYTPMSIRNFCERIGISKRDSLVDVSLLENSIRLELNAVALRNMGVLKPLKVVIDNYPEGLTEELDAINNPKNSMAGVRKIPFSREIYIEKDDFMEDPVVNFFRLGPGREIRLRYAYLITCVGVIKDDVTGEVVELRCTYDPLTRGGKVPDGRKVRSTIHWVSALHAVTGEVRLYDRLFLEKNPDDLSNINPDSFRILNNCKLEPCLANVEPGYICQFERLGYFCTDLKDSNSDHLVFNRVVTLRDVWAKINNKKNK